MKLGIVQARMLLNNINRINFYIFISLFFLLKSSSGYGINDSIKSEHKLAIDSSQVHVRQLNPQEQEKIFEDIDYQYDRIGPAPKTWWDRFTEWLGRSIGKLFSSGGGQMTLMILPYLLIFAVIVIIILLVLKNDIRAVFYGKSASVAIDFKEFDEDIHNINFDEMIADAINKNDYRKAVRLHFLKLLKELTDKNFISWQIDKTNNDYSIELSNSKFGTQFKELALMYEYIWYGDFQLDEQNFRNSISKFKEFKISA